MQPVIMLVVSGIFMFAVIGGISLMLHYYTLKAAHGKGNFIVSKTGCHPMKTKLKLFLKWGITFEEPYEIEEKSARKVAYTNKQEIEEEIVRRYMCCVDDEQANTRQNMANRNGGMQQTQMNENVARVRQPLRTED